MITILQERGCDLIVIGTHGRTGRRHLLFGSVTEDVVRRAQCPVMVVNTPIHDAEATVRPIVGQSTSRTPT
jgi:universal stress protein A